MQRVRALWRGPAQCLLIRLNKKKAFSLLGRPRKPSSAVVLAALAQAILNFFVFHLHSSRYTWTGSRLPSRRGATTAALHTAVAVCATCWPSGPQSVCPTGAAAALVAALSTPSGGTTGEDHILMIHRSPPPSQPSPRGCMDIGALLPAARPPAVTRPAGLPGRAAAAARRAAQGHGVTALPPSGPPTPCGRHRGGWEEGEGATGTATPHPRARRAVAGQRAVPPRPPSLPSPAGRRDRRSALHTTSWHVLAGWGGGGCRGFCRSCA